MEDNRTQAEKLREAERELMRLQRNHEQHYKLVRKVNDGVAIGLTAAIIAATAIGLKALIKEPETPEITATRLVSMAEDRPISMLRYYTIEYGDTLIGISRTTGIPVQDIAADNNISNENMIYGGQTLRLYYNIAQEDLEYYTATVDVNGRTVQEIASEYYTSPVTIYELNQESIVDNYNGTYLIKSDTLNVPNFITQKELKELKEGYHK